MDLKTYTEKQLKDELARREQERLDEEAKQRRERLALILENREALLRVIPHSRTSCSDENPVNGLYSADYGPRCVRCGLMELDEYNGQFHNVTVDLAITKF